MRHKGTKQGRPKRIHGYPWFDWDTGEVDLLRLASHTTGREHDAVPAWLRAVAVPTKIEQPKPVTLAKIAGEVCRAWKEAEFRRPPAPK